MSTVTSCADLHAPATGISHAGLESLLSTPWRWLREQVCYLRWRCCADRLLRLQRFKELLATRPSPQRLLVYWQLRAREDLRSWLRGDEYPRSCYWHWGPFRKVARAGLLEALVPVLEEIARSQHERTDLRVRSLRALGHIHTPPAVAILLAFAGDVSDVFRQAAANALRDQTVDAEVVAADLARALGGRHRSERCQAARTVASLRLATPEILSGLLDMVRNPNRVVVQTGAQALGLLGHAAQDLVHELARLAEDRSTDPRTQTEIRAALGQIQSATAQAMARQITGEFQQIFTFLRPKE